MRRLLSVSGVGLTEICACYWGVLRLGLVRRQGFGGLSVGFSSVEFLCVGLLCVLCDFLRCGACGFSRMVFLEVSGASHGFP